MEITPELLALIVAVISLISPLLTTAANILYQVWIRKKDIEKEQYLTTIKCKKDLYLNYISCTGKAISRPSDNTLTEYGMYYPKILMYIDEEEYTLFNQIDQYVHNYDIFNARQIYPEIVKILKDKIQKLDKK